MQRRRSFDVFEENPQSFMGENPYKFASKPRGKQNQICQFCFQKHTPSQYWEGSICPKMASLVRQMRSQYQDKHKIKCQKCDNGVIKTIQKVTYKQTTKDFQKKLSSYDLQVRNLWVINLKNCNFSTQGINLQLNRNNTSQLVQSLKMNDINLDHLNYPQKQQQKVQINYLNHKCVLCDGKGYIQKIINSKEQQSVGFRGVFINPLYKKEKLRRKFEGFVNKDDYEDCSICLIKKDPYTKVIQLHCKHIFHPKCIKQWIAKKNQCPVCRSIDKDFENYHYKGQEKNKNYNSSQL